MNKKMTQDEIYEAIAKRVKNGGRLKPIADENGNLSDGMKFFGLGYNHPENLIPKSDLDVLVTHEPPLEILDYSSGTHWGNLPLRNSVENANPLLHLFGHAHESYGTTKRDGIIFSNASLLDDYNKLVNSPRLI